MLVRISFATGNDGVFAIDCVKEFFRRRGLAAVMSDFEDIAVEVAAHTLDKGRLVDFVAVAREHQAEAVVFEYADGRDGVFLFRAAEIAFVVILLRRAVEGQTVGRVGVRGGGVLHAVVRDHDGVRVLVGVHIEVDVAVGLRKRGYEKFRINIG